MDEYRDFSKVNANPEDSNSKTHSDSDIYSNSQVDSDSQTYCKQETHSEAQSYGNVGTHNEAQSYSNADALNEVQSYSNPNILNGTQSYNNTETHNEKQSYSNTEAYNGAQSYNTSEVINSNMESATQYEYSTYLSSQTSGSSADSENASKIQDVVQPETSINVEPPKHKKKNRRFLKVASFFILFVFTGGLLFGGGYFTGMYFGNTLISDFLGIDVESNKNQVIIKQVTPAEISSTEEENLTAPVIIAREVGPSVVTVISTIKTNYRNFFDNSSIYSEGTGSGIIFDIDEDYLYIVTNHHVIDDAEEVNISFITGDTFKAEILGYDSKRDVAVLAIDIDEIDNDIIDSIAVATFGNSDLLHVGELAVAIGSPLGKQFSNTVTTGVISAVDRVTKVQDEDVKFIQTDAAINPGNSGGALVNARGEIIGINTAKYIEASVEGMGFAIPINDAIPIIKDILDKRDGGDLANQLSPDRPFLGVGISDITEEIYNRTGIPFGVYIMEVYPNSGADEAGLKRGDVIFSINSKKILNTTELQTYISTLNVGDTIEVSVIRDDSILTFDVPIYSYKEVMGE